MVLVRHVSELVFHHVKQFDMVILVYLNSMACFMVVDSYDLCFLILINFLDLYYTPPSVPWLVTPSISSSFQSPSCVTTFVGPCYGLNVVVSS